MAHRAEGLNDIFEHDVTVRENLHTKGGTVRDTPTQDTSLVNKEYVDSFNLNTGIDFFLYDDASTDVAGYKQLLPVVSSGAQHTLVKAIAANDTLVEEWVTETTCECAQRVNTLTAGIYNFHLHLSAAIAGKVSFYYKLYIRSALGVETLLFTSIESETVSTSEGEFNVHGTLTEDYKVETDDRLLIKMYGNTTHPVSINATMYYEGDTATRITIRGLASPRKHSALAGLAYADAGHTGFAEALGVDDNYVTDAEKIVIGNTSGTNTGDQVAGDFAHNSLTGLNDGTSYEHITQTQKDALHAVYTDAEAVSAVATADDYIKNDADDTTSGNLTMNSADTGGGLTGGLFIESGKHHINSNDGGGNFNIRIGNNFTTGITEDGYASHWTFSQSTGDWSFKTTTASQLIDEAPVYNTIMSLSKEGNMTILGTVDGVDIATDVGANTSARHAESHTAASHSDISATGTEINTACDGATAKNSHTHTHASTTGRTANDHHAQSHTVVSHSDTTATGAELNTLTGGGETALHSHAGGGGGPIAVTGSIHSTSSTKGAIYDDMIGAFSNDGDEIIVNGIIEDTDGDIWTLSYAKRADNAPPFYGDYIYLYAIKYDITSSTYARTIMTIESEQATTIQDISIAW